MPSDHVHPAGDIACAMAHGELPVPTEDRRLVAVFASPVAVQLVHLAAHVGFQCVVVDPSDPPPLALDGVRTVRSAAEADIDDRTDVVVTDHDRPELGDVLASVLATPARWVGVMGSPRHTAPHVEALQQRGVPEETIGRVHRPIGLDIGSRSPAEIAVSTVAGLLAHRAGRNGGAYSA
jgi:xanthine/CO dehydrogenase XdhC/CoxF family maturation factor